jgi:hypothetical protein
MKIKIELTEEAKATMAALERLPQTALVEIAKAMQLQNDLTVSHIQREYLSFPKAGPSVPLGLRRKSGRYAQSLRASKPVIAGQSVVTDIGSNAMAAGGDVSYPAVHEFGARIDPFDIHPKKPGGVLRFMIGQRVVFSKVVHHPGATIPARAPIQHGIADRIDDYSEAVSNAIITALNK